MMCTDGLTTKLHPLHPLRRRGFTLVELLVVIAIIALLIAILMPVLSAVRQRAQTLQCATHLRSIGQAMLLYAGDNRGMIPRDYDTGYDKMVLQGKLFWAELFAPYLAHEIPHITDHNDTRDLILRPIFAQMKVYQCPAFPIPEQDLDYVSNAWDWENPGSGNARPANISRFKHASVLIFVTEANSNRWLDVYRRHDVFHVRHLPGSPQISERRMIDDQRHGGRANAVFMDGHVETRLLSEFGERDFYRPN